MAIGINTPSVTVSASTTSAQGTLAAGSGKYVRVTNGSATSPVYVNAGTSPTATNANVSLAPFESRTFERDPNVDVKVAALLFSGTAPITFTVTGEDE